MPRKALGIGLGLSALVPPSKGESEGAETALPRPTVQGATGPIEIELTRIVPNPYQPRKRFDPENIESLAQSIKRHGLIQPILVRPRVDATGTSFELIAGERRVRAAGLAGLSKIPAIIKPLNHNDTMEYALIENIQREDLNPLEKAQAYARLLQEFSCTQEEIAERVGVDRSSVTNMLRLLNLPSAIQEDIAQGAISMGHAKVLLAVERSALQIQLAEQIKSKGLSVRQLTALIQDKPKKRENKGIPKPAPELAALERRLLHALGTKVSILPSPKGKGGEIRIIYYSLDDLDRILERFD